MPKLFNSSSKAGLPTYLSKIFNDGAIPDAVGNIADIVGSLLIKLVPSLAIVTTSDGIAAVPTPIPLIVESNFLSASSLSVKTSPPVLSASRNLRCIFSKPEGIEVVVSSL